MKHLEQYVALKGHSVSAGCLSWFIWFSQNISTECLFRTEWHIESPHPEDGLLESSYTFKEFFLFCSRGIWNSKTTPLSRNVTQMAALESKPCFICFRNLGSMTSTEAGGAGVRPGRWEIWDLICSSCSRHRGLRTCIHTRLHTQYSSEKLPQRLCSWLTLHPTVSGQKGIFPE